MELLILLVALGVVFSILLTILVCLLWRYVERTKKLKLVGYQSASKRPVPRGDAVSDFEIPVSYRTVKAQQPFLQTEYYIQRTNGSEKSFLSADQTKSSSGVYEVPGRLSPTFYDSDTASVGSSPETSKKSEKQRRIDNDMMEHLQSFWKGDSSREASEESGVSANEEVFSNTTVGAVKKRIAGARQRRKRKNDKVTYKKSGQITFTTQYKVSEKTLVVHVLRAFDLGRNRQKHEVNPFVRTYLMPGKKQKQNSKYQKGQKNPFYNERFHFVGLTEKELNIHKLKLKVYNHSRIGKSDNLGEVDITLNSLDIKSLQTFNVDLFLKRSESSLASVSISLCHHATFGKLEVIIQESRNLPNLAFKGVYAIVCLFKDDQFERKETTVKYRTADPLFNEALEFPIQTSSAINIDTFSLVVTLAVKKHLGRDQVLGHIIFSMRFPDTSPANHWRALGRSPHKTIQMWHSLVDPSDI